MLHVFILSCVYIIIIKLNNLCCASFIFFIFLIDDINRIKMTQTNMEFFDFIIVGGGIAGTSCATRVNDLK